MSGEGPVAGRVVEILPQAKFRVEIGSRDLILAHWASGVERNYVRLRPGDEVELVLSPQDRTRGRIVKVIKTV